MNSDACNGHMFQFTPSTAVHTSRPTPKSVTFISNASGQTIFGDCSISATAISKGQGRCRDQDFIIVLSGDGQSDVGLLVQSYV